jgi:replication-associated recombination protein RarA
MIFGHRENIELFTRLWQKEQLPSVLIFAGSRGLGKSLVAHWLARLVLYGSQENDFSNLNFTHPDFLIFDPLSDDNTSLSDVRLLLRSLKLAPFSAGKRFVLIDHAENISISSFQLLLKPLEESKTNTYFVIVVSSLSKIPLTIRSRAQIFNFSSLNTGDLDSFLKHIQKIEEFELPNPELVYKILDFASGSPSLLKMTLANHELFDEVRNELSHLFKGRITAISTLTSLMTKSPPSELAFRLSVVRMLIRRALYKSVTTPHARHFADFLTKIIEAESLIFDRKIPTEQVFYPLFINAFKSFKAD